MKSNPVISVIMPVYNVEKYLSDCLDSVLAQTFTDFELICINDGSTDNSPQILADYAAKDTRIKIINQPNQRQAAARNNGLSHALGDYIYFMDSDDTAHPQLLEICYKQIMAHNADMVCFAFSRKKETKHYNDISKIKTKIHNNPLFISTYAKHFRITFNVWTKFFSKKLLQNTKFMVNNQYEDYVFVYEILAQKPHTVIMDEALYFYTINPNSVSAQKCHPKQITDYHDGINYLYNIYKQPHLQNELSQLKLSLIPILLKSQLKKCQKAPENVSTQMQQCFAQELADLQSKGLLSWHKHNLWRYWQYLKLINSCANRGGYLKVVKLMGGMGNQMFQYAFGQALQSQTDDAVVYDKTWFTKNHSKKVANRNYVLDIFGLTPNFATSQQLRKFKYNNIFSDTHNYRVNDTGWGTFNPEILQLKGNVYYNGFFQNEKYFADISSQIRKNFNFPTLPKDDTFNQSWLQKIKQTPNSVCVHLRRGDYINLDGWVLPLSYYRKAVAYIGQHLKNPTFFVFGAECDDYIKKEFDIGYKFETIGETNAKQHEDWKDMFLMSSCQHAIIANSTFSWWAAWLGDAGKSNRIVTVPSPFVENDEIIPQHWIKITR